MWQSPSGRQRGKGSGSKKEKEGSLMSAGCLSMIRSQLTSDQPCHQQESAGEKDESGGITTYNSRQSA